MSLREEEIQGGGREGDGDGSESTRSPEEVVLCTLLKHAKASSEVVSSLASTSDSFSLAWLNLYCVRTGSLRVPLRSLDLSECQLPSGKVLLLLQFLSKSFEDLTLCRSLLTGRAFTRLRSLLGRLNRQAEEEGEGSRRRILPALRGVGFAAGSLKGLKILEEILDCLPPSVDSLSFKGNSLDEGEFIVLLEWLRKEGRGASVRLLDLTSTPLMSKMLKGLKEVLTSASPDSPHSEPETKIQMEHLCLGPMTRHRPDSLAFVGKDLMPRLRTLKLQFATFEIVTPLMRRVGNGETPWLENLEMQLGDSRFHSFPPESEPHPVDVFAGALTVNAVPHLKAVRLKVFEGFDLRRFLLALSSETVKRPPSMALHLHFPDISLQVQALGSVGPRIPFLRSVQLRPRSPRWHSPNVMIPFLTALRDSPCAPAWEHLDLSGPPLTLLQHAAPVFVETMRVGRLSALRKLNIRTHWPFAESVLEVLSETSLPVLTDFEIQIPANNRAMEGLTKMLKAGNCPVLERFCWAGHARDTRPEKSRVIALIQSLSHLRRLRSLSLIGKRGCDALEELVETCGSELGRLPSLENLCLRDCAVRDSSLTAFASRSFRLPSLVFLDLSDNDVSMEGLKAFLNALGPQSLRSLSKFVCECVEPDFEDLTEGVRKSEVKELFEKAWGEGKLQSLKLESTSVWVV